VGYEKRFNWGLQYTDEDAFVEAVLAGQPEPPRYFAEMKRINKMGPELLGGIRRPVRLPHSRLAGLVEEGALVIDTREAVDYAAGHVPGTLNIPINRSFNTWAGWLVPYDRDFYLIVDERCEHCVDEAVRDLALIGLDRVAGYLPAKAVAAWAAGGRELEKVDAITAPELARRIEAGEVNVLDVRGQVEWETGHIAGARHIPLGYLPNRLEEVPADRPLVVHCQSGGRSAIAAALLQREGIKGVLNLAGGIGGWKAAGFPVEVPASAIAG
jgi:hydroxyacylglutathione hydrolase